MEENYFKLLEWEQKSKEKNEPFPLEKRIELAHYQVQISDHFRWKLRDEFIEAMVDFLDNKIDFDNYVDQFYELQNQIDKSKAELESDLEKLRAFKPDPRSKGFSSLIENLFSDIRVFEPDPELRTPDEISKESLVNGIKEFLIKIQEY